MNTEKMSRMWQQKSQEEFEHFATWRAAHEDATLAEIETVMDQHLNRVRAAVLQQAAQASEPLEADCIRFEGTADARMRSIMRDIGSNS